MLLFNWIVRKSPRRYWLWIWLATLPLMVLARVCGAAVLTRCSTSSSRLSKNHAALVDKLEQVVARTGTSIPPERMFLMKASEKTQWHQCVCDRHRRDASAL